MLYQISCCNELRYNDCPPVFLFWRSCTKTCVMYHDVQNDSKSGILCVSNYFRVKMMAVEQQPHVGIPGGYQEQSWMMGDQEKETNIQV